MPYIAPANRPSLDHFIHKLRYKILDRTWCFSSFRNYEAAFQYLKYMALFVGKDVAFDAIRRVHKNRAMRYRAVNDIVGLFNCVSYEIKRRKLKGDPAIVEILRSENYYNQSLGALLSDAGKIFDEELFGLVGEIFNLAEKPDLQRGSLPNSDYDFSYMGLCNYTLTSLSVGLVQDVFCEAKDLRPWFVFLAYFWERLAKEFYDKEAASYEDMQIKRNGDCKVFKPSE